MPSKVLLAMSGGVDSSVAAAILKDAGHDVVGVFMRLGSPGETLDELTPGAACEPAKVKIGHQGCCSINDAADARLVAAELGIPFYVVNFKKDFARIIDYFTDAYAQGRTPNPCVRCNDWLKFGKLHDYAQQIGAAHVASGHYARIDRSTSTPRLARARDHHKDQSYVLFGVPQPQLASTLLPVGEYESKQALRDAADKRGLPVSDKPDSQEICFVPDNDYAGLVERKRPEVSVEGDILDTNGDVVGKHQGQHKFTLGQRRGLNLAAAYPLYVISKDPTANTVTVGQREDTCVTALTAAEANWLTTEPPSLHEPVPVLARYRSNSAPVPATVSRREDKPLPTSLAPSGRTGAFDVVFDEPQHAVAPGQAVVLYEAARPDLVLAGGWIINTDLSGSDSPPTR
ncbi:MAG: tRNA 2-thiouridine(34) synthase MnmA [Planctomycetota bacterium]